MPGTLFRSEKEAVLARKQWLVSLRSAGTLIRDQGACEQLTSKGSSLLPVGVKESIGEYRRGDAVTCCDESGEEIGRGLINYSSSQVLKICGKPTSEIELQLGFLSEEELIHRDNFVLLG